MERELKAAVEHANDFVEVVVSIKKGREISGFVPVIINKGEPDEERMLLMFDVKARIKRKFLWLLVEAGDYNITIV